MPSGEDIVRDTINESEKKNDVMTAADLGVKTEQTKPESDPWEDDGDWD